MQKIIGLLIISTFLFGCNEKVNQSSEPIQEDVNSPMIEKRLQEHTAEVHVTVPDSRWSISINKVIQSNDHIAVICQLTQSEGMGMMVISEVVDAVKFTAEDLPIKYYVLGKTWSWENSESYSFVDSISTVKGLNIPFVNTEPSKPGGAKKNEM